jgi:hypothetical protein
MSSGRSPFQADLNADPSSRQESLSLKERNKTSARSLFETAQHKSDTRRKSAWEQREQTKRDRMPVPPKRSWNPADKKAPSQRALQIHASLAPKAADALPYAFGEILKQKKLSATDLSPRQRSSRETETTTHQKAVALVVVQISEAPPPKAASRWMSQTSKGAKYCPLSFKSHASSIVSSISSCSSLDDATSRSSIVDECTVPLREPIVADKPRKKRTKIKDNKIKKPRKTRTKIKDNKIKKGVGDGDRKQCQSHLELDDSPPAVCHRQRSRSPDGQCHGRIPSRSKSSEKRYMRHNSSPGFDYTTLSTRHKISTRGSLKPRTPRTPHNRRNMLRKQRSEIRLRRSIVSDALNSILEVEEPESPTVRMEKKASSCPTLMSNPRDDIFLDGLLWSGVGSRNLVFARE